MGLWLRREQRPTLSAELTAWLLGHRIPPVESFNHIVGRAKQY